MSTDFYEKINLKILELIQAKTDAKINKDIFWHFSWSEINTSIDFISEYIYCDALIC